MHTFARNPSEIALRRSSGSANSARRHELPSSPVGVANAAISRAGDPHEQEADRISEQVMRMPEPQGRRPCACGGGCPRCESERRGNGRERLQQNRTRSVGAGQIDAPPIIQTALASPGEALETSVRIFMEQRFGRDFGDVRVHTDSAAAESADAIDARAYTVGSHIVLGAGQYEPQTSAGRALLAHELTHVLQGAAGNTIRRQPTAEDVRARRRDARLKALSEDPDEAHKAWGGLTNLQKTAVIVQMTKRFGKDFANNFLALTKKGYKSPGYTVSNSEHTPEWFQSRGYRLRGRTQGATPTQTMEYWVHPSGHEIWQMVDSKRDVPPVEDCSDIADVTLGILSDTVTTETSAQADLTAEKERLEKMNKTTDDYCSQYNDYIGSLKAMKARIDVATNDVEELRKQLVDMKCPVDVIDTKLQELQDLGIWVDIELSPMGTQFMACIKVRPPIDMPDDDE